jgi:hypothetical protein
VVDRRTRVIEQVPLELGRHRHLVEPLEPFADDLERVTRVGAPARAVGTVDAADNTPNTGRNPDQRRRYRPQEHVGLDTSDAALESRAVERLAVLQHCIETIDGHEYGIADSTHVDEAQSNPLNSLEVDAGCETGNRSRPG